MQPVWSIGMTIEEAEKRIIENSLQFFQGNKTMTANSLGISIRGLDHKMKKMEIVNIKKVRVEERKDIGSDNSESENN